MKEERIKGIGLCRVSTIEQGKGTSLESQEEWVKKKASEMDVELVAIIKREVSGEEFPNEVIDQILKLTKKEKLSYVFVYQIDRLTRGMYPGIDLIKEIEKREIKIVTYSRVLDPNDIHESFSLHIDMAVSELEQKTRRERITRGIKTRLKRGEFPFKHLPFGYQRDDKNNLALKIECMPIIKFIFDTFIQIKNYRKTWKRVNKKYLLSIEYHSIKKILINPIYIGYLTWGHYGKSEEKFFFPELKCIDEETFEIAQSIINKISRNYQRDNEKIPNKIMDFIDKQGIESALELIDCLLPCCPKCKSTDLQRNGHETVGGRRTSKFICKKCSHGFRLPSRRMLNLLEETLSDPKTELHGENDLAENESSSRNSISKIPSNDLTPWMANPKEKVEG